MANKVETILEEIKGLTLLEAAEGSVVGKAAQEAMRAKEVRSPERFAGMLLPGRWQAWQFFCKMGATSRW